MYIGIDVFVCYVEWFYGVVFGIVIEEINWVGDNVILLFVVGYELMMLVFVIVLVSISGIDVVVVECILEKFLMLGIVVLCVVGYWVDVELGCVVLVGFYVLW